MAAARAIQWSVIIPERLTLKDARSLLINNPSFQAENRRSKPKRAITPTWACYALFGVVVLNGVVMISYVNQLRREGSSAAEAAFRARWSDCVRFS